MSLRRRTLLAVLVAATLVVAADVAVRALAPQLPEPLVWYDRGAQVKVAQMTRLAREGGVDVVFAGNSMVGTGINPAFVDVCRDQAGPCYNAALSAGVPTVMEPWLQEVVVPKLRPKAVVLALTSLDFNGNGHQQLSATESYENAPMARDDVFAKGTRELSRASYLFRYRTVIRQPANVASALERAVQGMPPRRDDGLSDNHRIGPSGEGIGRLEDRQRFPIPEQLADEIRNELLNDFEVTDDQVRALRRTISFLKRRNIEVILVDLPVTDAFIDLHPNGRRDYERYRTTLRRIADDLDLPLIDGTQFEQNELFADPNHMNGQGARRFGDYLSRELAGHPLGGGTAVPDGRQGGGVPAARCPGRALDCQPSKVGAASG